MKKSVSIISCITLSALIAIAGVLCLSRSTAKAENSQSFEIIDVTKTFPVTISQFKVSEEVITLQDLKFKDEDIPLERCEIYFAAHSAYDVTGDDFLNNMEYLQEISKYLQEEIGSNTAININILIEYEKQIHNGYVIYYDPSSPMSYRLRALYQFGNSASVEILSNPLTRDQIIQAYQETYKPEEGDFIDLINGGSLNDIPIDDNLIANLENLYVEQCFLNLYTIFDTTENLGGFYGDMTIRIF